MLELTFGLLGIDQQTATIHELVSKGLLFNSDELTLILGITKEPIEDLLRALVESGYLSIIHIGPKIYYSGSIPIDSKIIVETDDLDPGQDISLLTNLVKHLQSEVDSAAASIELKEEELDHLDELIDKWQDSTIQVFQDIRNKWSQPLCLEQLAVQAGFDPDTLDLDFEDSSL